MDQLHFIMHVQKRGSMKYIMLTVIPTVLVGFLVGMDVAAWIFIFVAALLLPAIKNYSIVVFRDSMTRKDPRGRFDLKVHVSQISYYQRNFLDEIVLHDRDNKQLIRIPSNMTNIDRLTDWLAVYDIEHK